ncbi:nucleotidyltransferase domain-containing protein, partial [Streptomyces sp. GC420]|uniref:nucleotidyltransferase domain-containing protein n=1 Tax=Streptomyces sp. GC420 TaxID=2697568 RepID=UPI001414EB36
MSSDRGRGAVLREAPREPEQPRGSRCHGETGAGRKPVEYRGGVPYPGGEPDPRGEPDKGLDSAGYIAREGSLGRIGEPFRPVVAALRDRAPEIFGRRLRSAYLYGSVPRGNARPGRSDLDVLLVLREEPTAADRADADALEKELDAGFEEIDGAGILLYSRARLLSEAERYDMGWFVACLCTPLLGEDLAEELPRYRPDGSLARGTNGDLARCLPRWRERLAHAGTDTGTDARTNAEVAALARAVCRKLVRTGFTLVMPRWQGWTSDLARCAEVFAGYYPGRGVQMRAAAALAVAPLEPPVPDAAVAPSPSALS